MDRIALQLKDDAKEAYLHWDAFWKGDIIDRPVVCVTSPIEDDPMIDWYDDNYYTRVYADLDKQVQGVLGNFRKRYYGGEALPKAFLSFGCDEVAAFCGGKLCFHPNSPDTNWSAPFITDWEAALPFVLNDENPLWQRMLRYIRLSAECYYGKMFVDPIDLHTNMDLLMAARGSEALCMDLFDCPGAIDRAMESALEIFRKVWRETRKAGNGAISEGATLQCDFSCMISPAMFRRWALPILEEEAKEVGRVTYHWDGVNALIHTDDIIASRGLYCIAFVPGEGNGTHADCIDLYRRIQSGGKAVSVNGPPEMIKWMHKQLDPRLTVYHTETSSRKEAEDLLQWFVRNT